MLKQICKDLITLAFFVLFNCAAYILFDGVLFILSALLIIKWSWGIKEVLDGSDEFDIF